MIFLSISITGNHAVGVDEMDRRVKRGDKIPRWNLDAWIWRVTTIYGGISVRKFILFLTATTWLGLIVATISLISNLVS